MATVTELGQKVKAKYPGQYDDLSDDELGRKVKARFPGQYDDFTDTAPQLAAMPSPGQRLLNRGMALLPAAGSALGGLGGAAVAPELGPLGPIGGASIGGAAGKSLQQAILGRPASPQELGGSALAGATQEALGIGLGKVAGRFGRGLIPKTVTFRKAETPSVILNEFGKPFMIPGETVTFTKGATRGAKTAADMAVDLAGHSLGPGGVLVRPLTRGLRGKIASGGASLGRWLTSPGFQNFARQFPRAAAALHQVAAYEDTTAATAPFARR